MPAPTQPTRESVPPEFREHTEAERTQRGERSEEIAELFVLLVPLGYLVGSAWFWNNNPSAHEWLSQHALVWIGGLIVLSVAAYLVAAPFLNGNSAGRPDAFVTVLGFRFPRRREREDIRSTSPIWESDRPIVESQPAVPTTRNGRNGFAIAGLSLGLAGILLNEIGLIPILAIVFSGIGLGNARKSGGRGRTQGWVGLVLGILYTLVYLRTYGRI